MGGRGPEWIPIMVCFDHEDNNIQRGSIFAFREKLVMKQIKHILK